MGRLTGDLSILSLADLLQHLASNRHAGTLTLKSGDQEKTVHVSPEGLRLLTTTTRRGGSLGEILIRTKKITRAELDQLLEQQRRTGTRLGELVSRLGRVSPADIQQALREQVQEEIYDLYTWSDGTFDFLAGPPPPPSRDNPMTEISLDAQPASIMLEAARRADEMMMVMKVVRDETLVPFKTNRVFTPNNHGLPPDLVTAVYNEINGRYSVTEVVRRSLYPRFEALRAMYVLLSKEFAKVLDREGATVVTLKHETSRRIPPTAAAKAAAKGKSVLLMGDMVKYRSALAQILRDGGYAVVEEVATGMMGLLARKEKLDVVILDVSLNINDGFQFCTWIKENLNIPIVILSADPSREAGLKALESGARAYVVKPFTSEVILRTVGNVIQPASGVIPTTTSKS